MNRIGAWVVAVGMSIAALAWPPIRAGFAEGPPTKGAAAAETIFDPDPAHPWNRLHAIFYIRDMGNGHSYIHQGPDAPFGRLGPFLVGGASHDRAIAALDDFLRAKDDARIDDPMKRALLQHDLWYIFDHLSQEPDDREAARPKRRAIQKGLAQVMRRLEQPADRLRALPDNYAIAVKGREYPARFDPQHPTQAYLPADLRLDGSGPWVAIRHFYSRGPGLAAPEHTQFANGLSVFVSLIRLPGDRKATEDYVARLPLPAGRTMPDNLPELPDGSQVALVRRMLLVDDKGELQATPVTESVQIRIFPKAKEQHFFEFTMDRAGLLSGRGGLRATGPEDFEYFGFAASGNLADPFPLHKGARRPDPGMSRCIGCHQGEKLFTINTLGFGLKSGYDGAFQTGLTEQVDQSFLFMKKGYAWGMLQGLRETAPP